MGRSWALLCALGALLGRSWAFLGRSCGVFGASWRILGRFGVIPGRFWRPPGCFLLPHKAPRPSKTTLAPTREHNFQKITDLLLGGLADPSGTHFWSPLGALGTVLAALGALWGRSWPLFGQSWPLLGRSWAALGRSWGPSWHPCGPSWAPRANSQPFFTLLGCLRSRFHPFFVRFSYDFLHETAFFQPCSGDPPLLRGGLCAAHGIPPRPAGCAWAVLNPRVKHACCMLPALCACSSCSCTPCMA